MSFLGTFVQMLVLFAVVIVGFCANKCKLMDKELSKRLSALVINVTAPFIILSSAMGDKGIDSHDIVPVVVAGTLMLVFMTLIAIPLIKVLRIETNLKGAYHFMFVFGNINFIGFPVVGALFGEYAIFYASLLSIPFNLMVFLLGVYLITNDKSLLKLRFKTLFSPCLSATYIAIALVLYNIHVYEPIVKTCDLIGQITIPISLLIIGSALADIPIKHMIGKPIMYVVIALKQIVIPCLILLIFLLTPLDRKYADVLMILSAMPIAAYGTMFCLKYGKEHEAETLAQATFLSTLFSLITIPILSTFLSLSYSLLS